MLGEKREQASGGFSVGCNLLVVIFKSPVSSAECNGFMQNKRILSRVFFFF